MTDVAYDGLADVYEWLVPETLLTPEGTFAAFSERLSFWAFTRRDLGEDLCQCGFTPETSTYAADVDRYLITARRTT